MVEVILAIDLSADCLNKYLELFAILYDILVEGQANINRTVDELLSDMDSLARNVRVADVAEHRHAVKIVLEISQSDTGRPDIFDIGATAVHHVVV